MGRRNQIRQEHMKKWIYVSVIIILFCLFSFFAVFHLYNKNLEKIANESLIDYSLADSSISEETVDVSFSDDKGIETVVLNESGEDDSSENKSKSIVLKNAENEVENTSEKSSTNGKAEELASVENNAQEINANPQENVVETVVDNTVKNENENVQTTAATIENVVSTTGENKELEFVSPVSGDIIKDYAEDTLVYSKTLDEWIVHLGVDIKANKTSVVKAAESGIIEKINYDPRYGDSITIEHGNGFKTVYSNLLVTDFFKVGEKVEKGDTIGTVGDSASFEISDDSHLHFEMYKDGENVNPTLYLK